MKKQFAIFVLFLALVNGVAGVLLYSFYFPWVSDIEYRKKEQIVRSDLLDLNIRLAANEYRFSKTIVDQASLELNRSIKQRKPSDLELPKEIREALSQERYKIYMEYEAGPIGILKLNEQNYLVLGPYVATYENINLQDLVVYIFLLLGFNYITALAAYSYLKSRFQDANEAINKVSSSVYINKNNEALDNVSNNTPLLVKKIFQLQKEHKRNLYSQRDLMHAVAHEFRGPMARISFAIDLLTSNPDSQKAESLKSDIENSLEELDSLVKEVLDYSRLKDGQLTLTPSNFNLLDTIDTVIKKVSPLYQAKHFEVALESDDAFNCWLDQKLVERCILNLVSNAAKFSHSRIKVSIQKNTEDFSLIVEDDGNGVPPGKRERIFEPFTRLDHSRSRGSGGAGLGLAIVKNIAKRHQGSIKVAGSENLGGARFILKLPIKFKSNQDT